CGCYSNLDEPARRGGARKQWHRDGAFRDHGSPSGDREEMKRGCVLARTHDDDSYASAPSVQRLLFQKNSAPENTDATGVRMNRDQKVTGIVLVALIGTNNPRSAAVTLMVAQRRCAAVGRRNACADG